MIHYQCDELAHLLSIDYSKLWLTFKVFWSAISSEVEVISVNTYRDPIDLNSDLNIHVSEQY